MGRGPSIGFCKRIEIQAIRQGQGPRIVGWWQAAGCACQGSRRRGIPPPRRPHAPRHRRHCLCRCGSRVGGDSGRTRRCHRDVVSLERSAPCLWAGRLSSARLPVGHWRMLSRSLRARTRARACGRGVGDDLLCSAGHVGAVHSSFQRARLLAAFRCRRAGGPWGLCGSRRGLGGIDAAGQSGVMRDHGWRDSGGSGHHRTLVFQAH